MSRDEFKKDADVLKRWWPYIVGLAALFWFAIRVASSATSTYDNDIAKKTDLLPILAKLETLSEQVKALTEDVKAYKTADLTYKNDNSADLARYKTDLYTHIKNANKQFEHLNRTIAFYTENYSFDANGKRTIKVIPHNKSN